MKDVIFVPQMTEARRKERERELKRLHVDGTEVKLSIEAKPDADVMMRRAARFERERQIFEAEMNGGDILPPDSSIYD